jgi:hypothetical protein
MTTSTTLLGVRRPGRAAVAVVAVAAIVAGILVGPTVAGSTLRAHHGLLQVSTSPEVPSTISVDGAARNTGRIDGLELPVGEYEICFSAVQDHLPPPCESVSIVEASTSTVVGKFTPAGMLAVSTDPPSLEPIVSVGGVERDRGATLVQVEVGGHEVCGGDLAGYVTPGCVDVSIEQGATTSVTLTYLPEAGGVEPPSGTNLLSSALHEMSGSSPRWTAQGNVVVATDTSVSVVGSQSLKVTVDASGPWQDSTGTARAGTPQFKDAVQIPGGGSYEGFLRVRPADDSATSRCEVRFFDGSGSILSTVGGSFTAARADTWTPLACGADAPSTARYVALRVFVDGADDGLVFNVDDAWLVGAGGSPAEGASQPTPEPEAEPDPEPDPESNEEASDPEPVLDSPVAPTSWQAAIDTKDYSSIRAWYRAHTGIAAVGLRDSDLTPSGNVSTTRDGQVIEGLLVTGRISVEHDNVTIRNTKVVNAGNVRAVDVPWSARDRVTRVNLENVSLIGTGGASEYVQAVAGTYIGASKRGSPGVQAKRVYINGFGGGFRLSSHGGDAVEYSMVENIRTHSGSHNTGLSFNGGDGKVVLRNWIEGSTSSAMSLYPDHAPVTNFTARGNVFDGGGYSVYAGYSKTYKDENHGLRFLDNLFSRNHWFGPKTNWNPSQPGNEWSGNRYIDGQTIN